MSSSDGSGGPDPELLARTRPGLPGGRTDTYLVETLIHLLIEKGLLTRNDALSVVQTVAQVQQGSLKEARAPDPAAEMDIHMLRRMYDSFELLEGRPADVAGAGDNVVVLRPPLHGDNPEFPQCD